MFIHVNKVAINNNDINMQGFFKLTYDMTLPCESEDTIIVHTAVTNHS